jgi:hypothetical protein
MILVAKDELKQLAETRHEHCVSLYLPTHRVTAHAEQDRIRLKNLLRQAEEHLSAGGLRTPEIRQLLQPAERLYEDGMFWRYQSDGLAIFLAPSFSRHYCLPLTFPELALVADSFHLKPLLPLLTGDGRFFVLAISQKGLRLLEGTRQGLSEVDLTGVPRSLAEALKYDDPEKQLQFHSYGTVRGGERTAMFHGHGQAHGEDEKDRLLRYFQQVDQGLRDLLRDERIPLVLAAVEYYLPIYRRANSYPHLVEDVIPGSPNGIRDEELHRRAWALLEPRFRMDMQTAADRYRQFAGTGRASAELSQVVPAAYQGRVESLFVALGATRWGRFDPESSTVVTHEQRQTGDIDLLDVAAVQAFRMGATVYAVPSADVPDKSPIAAVFRF